MSNEKQTFRFYRLSSTSETGRLTQEIMRKGNECNNAASLLAKELGALQFSPSPAHVAGGIGSLYFTRKRSAKKYTLLGEIEDVIEGKSKNLYCHIPNITTPEGSSIHVRIMQLPVVPVQDVAEAFGITGRGKRLPLWFRQGDHFYFRTEDCELSLPDFEPCTEGEFTTAINIADGLHRN